MNKRSESGICKLTGTHGPFVDSHIIPRALTRLSKTGEKYVEAGIGLGVQRRSDSWYDQKLVTQTGEDILSDIDSKGINELRSHRLVWSGWDSDDWLGAGELLAAESHAKHRLIRFTHPDELRIFFLSLLWRAAASTRPEFSEIVLTENDLEDLGRRVLHQDPGPPQDYPIQLFQLVTRGVAHNRTPLLERKRVINPDGSIGSEISYVRFYFDGLVSHILLNRQHELGLHYRNTCLGFTDDMIVFAHEFEQSRAAANTKEMAIAVSRQLYTPDQKLSSISAAVKTCWSMSDSPPRPLLPLTTGKQPASKKVK